VDIFVIERHERHWGNLGYAVHNTVYGRGIASEAAAAAIVWAFRSLSLHRLEAVISPDNSASLGVARKLGLEYECVRKDFELENKQWVDQVVYVAIKGRWKRPALESV
jgi:RimJ/RimL family protein N-acetyltransferase